MATLFSEYLQKCIFKYLVNALFANNNKYVLKKNKKKNMKNKKKCRNSL